MRKSKARGGVGKQRTRENPSTAARWSWCPLALDFISWAGVVAVVYWYLRVRRPQSAAPARTEEGQDLSLRLISCIAVVIVTTAVRAPTARGQVAGDEEIRDAVEAGLAVSSTLAGNQARFLTGVQQYGRLDLVLGSTWSAPQARRVRDFFYGAVSGPAKVDALELVNQFEQCGRDCRAVGQDSLIAAVNLARWLAESVRSCTGLV
jgi:hypothetical protein